MVVIAHHNGATSKNSMPTDITATAGVRRPPNSRTSEVNHGHVATTIIVAQTVAARKGLSTHSERASKSTIKTIARVLRVKSCCIVGDHPSK